MEESGMEISEKGIVTSKPIQNLDALKLLAYGRANSKYALLCHLIWARAY